MPTDPNLPPDADRLVADAAALNRWLDREHHSFPSNPIASSVARVLSSLTASKAALEVAEAELVEARRVIAPFAEFAAWMQALTDEAPIHIATRRDEFAERIPVRHFRAAAQFLAPGPNPGETR